MGFNDFSGNTGASEMVESTTTLSRSPVSNGTQEGSLGISYNFSGQGTDVFAGYFASLRGLTDTLISLDGSGQQPAETTTFSSCFLFTRDIYGDFLPLPDRSVDVLEFDVQLQSSQDVTLKIELTDEDGLDVFTRHTLSNSGSRWQKVSLSLPHDFSNSVEGVGDTSAFNWHEVDILSLIVERENVADGVSNPVAASFLGSRKRVRTIYWAPVALSVRFQACHVRPALSTPVSSTTYVGSELA